MFEEVAGLPLHPLAVHAAVVFVPLLALVALAYALVPKVRPKVGWAAVVLAVVAPVTAVVSRLSGEAFVERTGYPLQGLIADHADYGNLTMWVSLALGVLTLALVVVGRRSKVVGGALSALVVVAAVAAVVLVVLTGDAGARSVWEPRWQ